MSNKKKMVTIDGNAAAAHVAYAFSEVAAIFPITPSTPMGEYSDSWASQGRENVFGKKVDVLEMQSEAGAAGAVHGALSAGALTTTFTASQGLLLMIPNMHKIAGEMIPTVFHVSARSLAAQSLSIFGDHSDVMSCLNTGFAMTAASSIQETMDMAVVAHLATLKTEVPFLAFFDGFRTSHEIQKVEEISYDTIKEMIEPEYIERFRARAMRPESPIVKVAAQNPDVYFQGRETTNNIYASVPGIVQEYMDVLAKHVGRQYHLFDYVGAADAEKVLIVMGSACDTVDQTVQYLNKKGEKVGAIKVRLYRPFSAKAFIDAVPASCKKIAVLDRTKEPGSLGEPLYKDVVTVMQGKNVEIIGGRYGLSSKEFTPSHVKAIFDHQDGKAFHNFTVGIIDDVSNTSIEVKEQINVAPEDTFSGMFWGLGSDGTVGANKNSIKIIGDNTDMNAQAYFAYDSKKSGGVTTSHLRFGKSSVNMPWLIGAADFVACSNSAYIGRYDMLGPIKKGGVFLLNTELPSDEIFNSLTEEEQQIIIDRKVRFYAMNALKISEEVGLGNRTNTVLQAAFFKISGVLPEAQAIELMKGAIKKTFSRKGEDIVKMNWNAVDKAGEALIEVKVPASITKSFKPARLVADDSDDFTKNIIEKIMHQKGDDIPVSHMSFDGVLPTGTSKLEKRGVAPRVPHWESDNCIQCNQCVQSCPHAAIRAKQIKPEVLSAAPETFNTVKYKASKTMELQYKIQVYTDDCQGCGVCIETCPAKSKALVWSTLEKERALGEHENEKFFEPLPYGVLDGSSEENVKGMQFRRPLFEFSGACAGCGETPYVKLVTQICGDNMLAANATGCSSIYGGTFPTIPYCKNEAGRGPAWGNSLFEDNAEYGFGMRLGVDSNRTLLKRKVNDLLTAGTTPELTSALKASLELWDDKSQKAMDAQDAVKALLPSDTSGDETMAKIVELQDYFIDKSIWIIGGDGWAYDIGFGGVDHVMAAGKNVNILVVDTEVYSNTGGQASKATPIAAVAKFANAGMRLGKKNLNIMAMSYGYVYVASIALGANRAHAQKAIMEAEAYDGPSIIFAYAPCIAHGIDMSKTQLEEKRAVDCGYWPLYRYNPTLEEGKKFTWDCKEPTESYQDFIRSERRYTALLKTAPDEAEALYAEAEADAKHRWNFFKKMGEIM
ncbi:MULTISPECIES: pyruvate:ferredoxin (flavodoxin) oxidoreductase [unclassified Oceanispirochaeta]|uniref:pyruvate:ferredoxin (flavodoxin) oxidoreductase n=1 Tax=unclassified Oceanispirochaeta TaxID=2635722 RepID=UPI000E0960BD|nr:MULTISPECIES: pyruvate:ferredoxin (flavodoxin) oxidoreductase [unclassified Oceanispirochaeta]MBF9014862.1 pyruvate:ferredoxin (flavodoxin) oxidoreductase [Oceanispirochaeta sp. M2]NPD71457.1 pyruvate:ferredoxin (flavodoxin) oxidoreductase [Oceanispirochaeta sp. M1]RDG33418.1 pyruvate:ferredoxin (flavodoxin) oxidoreductase [Oceanispirochaeta sp. M1]